MYSITGVSPLSPTTTQWLDFAVQPMAGLSKIRVGSGCAVQVCPPSCVMTTWAPSVARHRWLDWQAIDVNGSVAGVVDSVPSCKITTLEPSALVARR